MHLRFHCLHLQIRKRNKSFIGNSILFLKCINGWKRNQPVFYSLSGLLPVCENHTTSSTNQSSPVWVEPMTWGRSYLTYLWSEGGRWRVLARSSRCQTSSSAGRTPTSAFADSGLYTLESWTQWRTDSRKHITMLTWLWVTTTHWPGG